MAVLKVYFPGSETPATQYAGPKFESEVTGTVALYRELESNSIAR